MIIHGTRTFIRISRQNTTSDVTVVENSYNICILSQNANQFAELFRRFQFGKLRVISHNT